MSRKKTFTSSINSRILATLETVSKKYNTPKNKIIEIALSRYFASINKTELKQMFGSAKRDKFIRSFPKTASSDISMFLTGKK